MDIRAVVVSFPNVTPLAGLEGAWHWFPVPGIEFGGVLSADESRLLQVSNFDSFDEDLAATTLEFAREHEAGIFARNPFLGFAEGFKAPAGYSFDAVAGTAPDVHEFYKVENPSLNPYVRVVFPAFACEFSGEENREEAVTRFEMLPTGLDERVPAPFLKMRYTNTRTRGHSTNPGRGFTQQENLETELRLMEGGPGSFVEFENRHGKVWRVEWHDAWFIAEWDTQDGTPREIGLDELLAFATARLLE